MITSCTCSGRTFARFNASAMATAPSRGAGSSESPPRNFPMGVRTAERMKASMGLIPLNSRGGKYLVQGGTGDVGQNVPVHPARVVEHGDSQLAVESQGAEEVQGLVLV